MIYKKSIKEIIESRFSTRAYDDSHTVEPDVLAELEAAAASLKASLWGEAIRFTVIPCKPGQAPLVSTYGSISHPPAFLLGKIPRSPNCFVSYAYSFEKLILKATELGLNTCWLGYYTDKTITDYFPIANNEVVPAVSPVGYKKTKGFTRDRLLAVAGFTKRKPFDELYFSENMKNPVPADSKYRIVLEMVRRAPSAGNLQPCRIVICGKESHFFLDLSHYKKDYENRNLQDLDLGIAMCHFELMCHEAGIPGNWTMLEKSPLPISDDVSYRVTFHEK